MRGKRFRTDQIIAILKEADSGIKVSELCRKYGVSDATVYNWKAKYAGMTVSDARRLKELEEENRRLKKLVADLSLDNQMLKEVNSKNW
jgi:putative transposase